MTNFSFAFPDDIFTEDVPLPFLYHGAKKSKMTKNSNQGGGGGTANDGKLGFGASLHYFFVALKVFHNHALSVPSKLILCAA